MKNDLTVNTLEFNEKFNYNLNSLLNVSKDKLGERFCLKQEIQTIKNDEIHELFYKTGQIFYVTLDQIPIGFIFLNKLKHLENSFFANVVVVKGCLNSEEIFKELSLTNISNEDKKLILGKKFNFPSISPMIYSTLINYLNKTLLRNSKIYIQKINDDSLDINIQRIILLNMFSFKEEKVQILNKCVNLFGSNNTSTLN